MSGNERAACTRRRGIRGRLQLPSPAPALASAKPGPCQGLCITTLSRVTTSRSEEPLGSSTGVFEHVGGALDRPVRGVRTTRPLDFHERRPPEPDGANCMTSKHATDQPAPRTTVTAHRRCSWVQPDRTKDLGAAGLSG